MARYVYGCSLGHRREVTHAMTEDPRVLCHCGQVMRRVPQVFRWYHNPGEVLLNRLDDQYRNYRIRKAKEAKTHV